MAVQYIGTVAPTLQPGSETQEAEGGLTTKREIYLGVGAFPATTGSKKNGTGLYVSEVATRTVEGGLTETAITWRGTEDENKGQTETEYEISYNPEYVSIALPGYQMIAVAGIRIAVPTVYCRWSEKITEGGIATHKTQAATRSTLIGGIGIKTQTYAVQLPLRVKNTNEIASSPGTVGFATVRWTAGQWECVAESVKQSGGWLEISQTWSVQYTPSVQYPSNYNI